jgi:hypothetical protein
MSIRMIKILIVPVIICSLIQCAPINRRGRNTSTSQSTNGLTLSGQTDKGSSRTKKNPTSSEDGSGSGSSSTSTGSKSDAPENLDALINTKSYNETVAKILDDLASGVYVSDGGVDISYDDDFDDDGVSDDEDNCITIKNADQLDDNDNGYGDVCEPEDGIDGSGDNDNDPIS